LTEKFPWEKRDATERRERPHREPGGSSFQPRESGNNPPSEQGARKTFQPSRYLAKKRGTLTQLQRVQSKS